MRFVRDLWSLRTNPKVVDKTPLLSTFLLELANISQLHRMWTEHTAAGQSMWGWMSVQLALWLWLNFYHVFNADNKFAIWGTRVGICLNSAVILSVVFFRYVLHAG